MLLICFSFLEIFYSDDDDDDDEVD